MQGFPDKYDPGLDGWTGLNERDRKSMNLIWQDGQYPYILAVNVAPGACEQDTRAHLKVKVCLPEYPDKSFWMYAMNDGSNPEGDTLVQPLPGQFRWESKSPSQIS